ncbi:hypothetical protein EBI01_02885 [Marinomonas rhizomae]|uniref:Uncharacterized protein n=1 Tax=Marinomonas rhizomae TaxID=491948 RepID=A0A366JF10_9GAMM|nr:hypothetical protein [Marinomonas rhizomae]RBP85572.1 hypothetical protein DFP80_10167 [Marinomonas rhizomae]RNF75794.1 hypothetical protein EBI01_02885 [Marinomonas rhizomae]
MFWELIATVFAGIGGAGIALLLRKITKQTAPKWLVPAFAGVAMLGFQIQGEYDWYNHQTSLLPKGIVVVKTVQEEAPWRPWSYVFPQTLRFIAADVENSAQNKIDPNLVLVDLYFFERRHTAKRVPQIVDCVQGARTDFTQSFSPSSSQSASTWYPLASDDLLLKAVCRNQA